MFKKGKGSWKYFLVYFLKVNVSSASSLNLFWLTQNIAFIFLDFFEFKHIFLFVLCFCLKNLHFLQLFVVVSLLHNWTTSQMSLTIKCRLFAFMCVCNAESRTVALKLYEKTVKYIQIWKMGSPILWLRERERNYANGID